MTPLRRRTRRKDGVNVDETELAELIAALHQAATFGEGLLDLNEQLLDALTNGANRPEHQGTGVTGEPACHGGVSRFRRYGSGSPG